MTGSRDARTDAVTGGDYPYDPADDAREAALADDGGRRTPAGLFGSSNSEGALRMEAWLAVMCQGCRRESVKFRRENGGAGGAGCELVSRAYADPGGADMPEWSPDATWPARFTDPVQPGDGLDPGSPWPVCMAWEPRPSRADRGLRRGPRRSPGQGELFGREEVVAKGET